MIKALRRKMAFKKYALSKLPRYTDSGERLKWNIAVITRINGYDTNTGKPKREGLSFLVGYIKGYNVRNFHSYSMQYKSVKSGKGKRESFFMPKNSEWTLYYWFYKGYYIIKDL